MSDAIQRHRDGQRVLEIMEKYVDLSEDEFGEAPPICDDLPALIAEIVKLIEEARSAKK